MTALSFVWASPETMRNSLSLRPVFLRNSGQIWDMESPGVVATILPLMSSGFRMFFSAKPITDMGFFCSATPAATTGAPLTAARIIVGTSA